MSRLDVLAELHGAAPAAPRELRERVREIAAVVPEPRRRLTWRRAAVVLVPAVLGLAAAAIVVGRNGSTPATVERGVAVGSAATAPATTLQAQAGATANRPFAPVPVPPARGRLQDYDATLSLRVHDATALSGATKRALTIVRSLGGFASAVNVNVDGKAGDATLRLRVPDRPGSLAAVLAELAAVGANVIEVAHERTTSRLGIGEVEVFVVLETRGPAHAEEVTAALLRAGYAVTHD